MMNFFPKVCIGCGTISHGPFCDECYQKWITNQFHIQRYLSQKGDEIIACCRYKPIGGKIIRGFKYARRFDLLPLIADAFSHAIAEVWSTPFTCIIPVPQSIRKMFSRGFHPVEMIGTHVSKMTSIPMDSHILRRKIACFDRDQASLRKIHRMKNLTEAFYSIKTNSWEQQANILLFDDVATTGTTLNRCKEAIQKNFPDWHIHLLVFAHG